MRLTFRALERDDVLAILNWRYAPPYDYYNSGTATIQEDLCYLLEPKNAYYAILNPQGELEGYCSFGSDAQVPGGDYRVEALDTGMGIRPDLTGQGQGEQYAQSVMKYGAEQYEAQKLRVTIAKFNKRAQRVWKKLGFELVGEFVKIPRCMSQLAALIRLMSEHLIGDSQMQPRMELGVESAAYRAMLQLERYVRGSDINTTLLELIKIRASQINGCAFCIDMHTKDARLKGETEQRLYTLNAWRETPFFTSEERAVLALTEAVTQIATGSVSDEIYDEVSRYFMPDEIADLLMAIVTINGWNRIAITTRMVPGSYEPQPLQSRKATSETLSV